MCEYCGCRDDPEIARLGAEHDAIVELADLVLAQLRSGEENMAGAVRRLRQVLIPHVQGEESGIFRLAEGMGLGSQYVDELEGDHRRFDRDLSDPAALDAAALEEVLDDLYHHITVEEYDLFPEVARHLRSRLGTGRDHASTRLPRSATANPTTRVVTNST